MLETRTIKTSSRKAARLELIQERKQRKRLEHGDVVVVVVVGSRGRRKRGHVVRQASSAENVVEELVATLQIIANGR